MKTQAALFACLVLFAGLMGVQAQPGEKDGGCSWRPGARNDWGRRYAGVPATLPPPGSIQLSIFPLHAQGLFPEGTRLLPFLVSSQLLLLTRRRPPWVAQQRQPRRGLLCWPPAAACPRPWLPPLQTATCRQPPRPRRRHLPLPTAWRQCRLQPRPLRPARWALLPRWQG